MTVFGHTRSCLMAVTGFLKRGPSAAVGCAEEIRGAVGSRFGM